MVRKILIILLFGFILRTLTSCICNCSDDTTPFDFQNIMIENLDNSGDWPVVTEHNEMYSKAVAFSVTAFAEDIFVMNMLKQINLAGFNSAKAFSCDCAVLFSANQKIEKITITTLFSISDQIPAMSNVTDYFVADSHERNNWETIYVDMDNIISHINPETYYDSGSQDIQVFLKEEVKNDKAQFIIDLDLSDGRVLSDTTNLITIIEQPTTL